MNEFKHDFKLAQLLVSRSN